MCLTDSCYTCDRQLMKTDDVIGQKGEPALVKLYMELTGESESSARNLFMYLDTESTERLPLAPSENGPESKVGSPLSRPGGMKGAGGAMLLVLAFGLWAGAAETNTTFSSGRAKAQASASQLFPAQPLSLADAINRALQWNPNLLRARKDIEAAEGIRIQTRAIVYPKVSITGSFTAVEPSDVDQLSVPLPGGPSAITFGTDKNWATQIKLVQSIYEGGRMLSSIRAARLTRRESAFNYETALANTVLEVQVAYADTLLAEREIEVQTASVELLSRELKDTTQRFDAGTMPRFNVLRAEVELANARPRLLRARNEARLARNNLANALGLDLPQQAMEDIPLSLSSKLEAEPYAIELSDAIAQALERRSELAALRTTAALRREDVTRARAGYKPSLQLFAGYDAHNSVLHSDLGYADYGWTTGAQFSWDIFDGFLTHGRVQQATAGAERADIDLQDMRRRIELEVRSAHSTFLEADEVVKSEAKVLEEAEEALRLARSRNEAGTGTQLDVLSAQTALTDARLTEIRALHDYVVAKARLERAIGPASEPQRP